MSYLDTHAFISALEFHEVSCGWVSSLSNLPWTSVWVYLCCTAMVSLRVACSAEQAVGTYGRFPILRWGVLVFLTIYLWVILASPSSQREDTYSSPEGLRMTVNGSFPQVFMRVHYWAGVLLIPFAVIQKHVSLAMGKVKRSSRTLRFAHKWLGYTIVLMVCFMAGGGFSLRQYSTFDGFQIAMVLFVAPWVLFALLVPISGYCNWGLTHVISGDALFKACVAVPLARSLGVLLQTCSALSLSNGYYAGILMSTVVIGVWATYDVILLVNQVSRLSRA